MEVEWMAFVTLDLALLIMICSLTILLDKKHETHIYPSEIKVLISREDVVQETEASWPDKVEYMVCDGSPLCHGPARSFSGSHVHTFFFCFCTCKMEITMRRAEEEVSVDGRNTPNICFLFQLREIFEGSLGVKGVVFP